MGKKSRRDRNTQIKSIKSKIDRVTEVNTIKQKINELGLGEGNPDIIKFMSTLDSYIHSEESYEGKIEIKGYKRVIEYLLPKFSKNICKVNLKYDKTI